MTLPFVKQGETIKAESWNALVREVNQLKNSIKTSQENKGGIMNEPALEVFVKNASSIDRSCFEIMGIEAQLYTTSPIQDQSRVLSCDTPSLTDHAGKFVILKSDIPAGAIGKAYISGTCLTQIYVNDTDHDRAEVYDSDATMLNSSEDGTAQIIWKESGTGLVWGLVRFPYGGSGGGTSSGTCGTPFDATYSNEHTEAANSSSYSVAGVDVLWHRDSPPSSTDGFKITLQSGEAYYEASDQILYAYYVDFYFDSAGMLLKAMPERRQIVDEPSDDCTSSS